MRWDEISARRSMHGFSFRCLATMNREAAFYHLSGPAPLHGKEPHACPDSGSGAEPRDSGRGFLSRGYFSRAYHLRDPAEPPCIDARMLKGGRSGAPARAELPHRPPPRPGGLFSQIRVCAERPGMQPNLRQGVPALANLSMHPNERTCRSCMRRGCSNWRESNPCWEKDNCGGCYSGYMWDRKTPSKRRRHRHGSASAEQTIYRHKAVRRPWTRA